jgi:3',5'-cyclic AMP phosphodiesterase CpdA
MLTIAQITDIHICTGHAGAARNEARLRAALAAIQRLKPKPAAILLTGDLTDHGEKQEYESLRDILRDTDMPLYFGMGNHDRREAFRDCFPAVPVDENGFIQYAVPVGGLRLVMCDTLKEGEEGGSFCEKRARWLQQTLDEAPHAPTILALHHPPIPSFIPWMDGPNDGPWLKRLAETIGGKRQILTLCAGHMHRAYHGVFAGQLVSVSPATSIQLTLDLSPVDLYVPDGREILTEEPPGFTLFAWNGTALSVHVGVAGDFAPAVTYTAPFRRK